MFLRIGRLIRRARLRRADDTGVAMAVVLGAMALGLLLSALIVSSTTRAIAFTAATRAGVQAQAAADAGVAVARAALQKTVPCSSSYSSTTAPIYDVKLWFNTGASPDVWVAGCPSSTSTPTPTKVRIVSRGTASMRAAGSGQSSQDSAVVEAIYTLDALPVPAPAPTPTPVPAIGVPTGSALQFDKTSTLHSFAMRATAESSADVLVSTGDFDCDGSSVVEGDVTVRAGGATLSQTCRIRGTLWASGTVRMVQSATVGGDVISSGGDVVLDLGGSATNDIGGGVFAKGIANIRAKVGGDVETAGAAAIQGGSSIAGSVRTGGQLQIWGSIRGSATSASTSATFLENTARIGGDLTVAGDLNSSYDPARPTSSATENEKKADWLKRNLVVGGVIRYRQSGVATPVTKASPTVPGWVNYDYDRAKWVNAGFTEVIWPSSNCSVDSSDPSVTQLKARTSPTVVNALGCSRLSFTSSDKFTFAMKTDVAFIAKGFDLAAMSLTSTAPRLAWFITPDGYPTTVARDCSNGAGVTNITNGTVVGSDVRALIYTPCTINTANTAIWRGQFYAGDLTTNPGDSLTVLRVPAPGLDLAGPPTTAPTPGPSSSPTPTPTPAPTPTPSPSSRTISDLESMRNRTTVP